MTPCLEWIPYVRYLVPDNSATFSIIVEFRAVSMFLCTPLRWLHSKPPRVCRDFAVIAVSRLIRTGSSGDDTSGNNRISVCVAANNARSEQTRNTGLSVPLIALFLTFDHWLNCTVTCLVAMLNCRATCSVAMLLLLKELFVCCGGRPNNGERHNRPHPETG